MTSSKRSNPKIAVAGVAAVDMTLPDPPRTWIGDIGRDAYTTDSMFKLDAPLRMGLGGNGAASAYVIARLGLAVTLNAPIGDDPAGMLVRMWLAEAGVECAASSADSTMVAITAVDGDEKRLGCVQYCGPSIDWALSADPGEASWLLIGIHAMASDQDLMAVEQTLGCFRSRGGNTVLDSGVGWLATIDPRRIYQLWSQVDYLVGTAEELGHWTNRESPSEITDAAMHHGPGGVVIKMGAEGAAYKSQSKTFQHQPRRPVDRAGLSIGAGDAFNGALVAGLARGHVLRQAVGNAQEVAAHVVASGRGVLGWSQRVGERSKSRR